MGVATAVQLVKLRRRAAEVVFTDATSGLSQTTAGDATACRKKAAKLAEVWITSVTLADHDDRPRAALRTSTKLASVGAT